MAHQPPLQPQTHFLPIPHDPQPHSYIHVPQITIGSCYDDFDVDSLPFVRMLHSFDLIPEPHVVPTITHNDCNVHQFLQSTHSAFALTQFTKYYPLVLDTGASISITPVLSDFVDGIQTPPVQSVNGLQSSLPVVGAGKVQWTVKDISGTSQIIHTYALYLPSAQVRLFSPQDYCRLHKRGKVSLDHRTAFFQDHTHAAPIEFPYHSDNGLPILLQDKVEDFSFFSSIFPLSAYNATILHPDNTNLTIAQKELLHWHQRLGHVHMRWIQQLLRTRNWTGSHLDPYGNVVTETTSYLPASSPKVASCPIPLCTACVLAKSSRKSSRSRVARPNPSTKSLKTNHLFPGQVISVDQYESTVRGRLPHTQGKERERLKDSLTELLKNSRHVFVSVALNKNTA